MFKELKEENLSLLNIYATILDTCSNTLAKEFLISRIYKILSKTMKARATADFPQTSYDMQVVNLVAYIREEKLAYAFLYASSLNTHNTVKSSLISNKDMDSSWSKFKAYIGL